jgi:hypothetical protein
MKRPPAASQMFNFQRAKQALRYENGSKLPHSKWD